MTYSGDGDFLLSGQNSKKKRGYAQRQSPDFGLGASGLAGIKVGRKEIVAKDFKVMKKVYTAIQNHQRRSSIF